MFDNSLQFKNAPSPIHITLSGIVVLLHPTISSLISFFIIALQLSLLSYTVLPSSTSILTRPLQLPNAHFPTLVTPFGIVILLRPLQPANAHSPILTTPSGIVICVNSLQPPNALSPIFVTLFGIIVLLQPIINSFVSFFIIALQLSLLSYTVLPSSTSILTRLLQLPNAESPILVTLFEIVMPNNPLQSKNASFPIFNTPSGITMLVRLLQSPNA